MRVLLSAALLVALVAPVAAGPRRILVLPLDGNADPAVRAKLNQTVQKLARESASGATVTVGDATFDETAAAVGCDAATPKCAIAVRTTLGVDELVYGGVTTDPAGQATVVIHRSSATKNPPSAETATLPAGTETPENQLAPLFGIIVAAPPPPEPLPPPPPPPPARSQTRRNLGIGGVVLGAAAVATGFVMWASASSKQDAIDGAPTQTVDQLRALEELEDQAETRAIAGDVLVIGGAILGGIGGWLLYTDHRERKISVTPVATPTGASVMMRGTW